MVADITITGAGQLGALGARLKLAGAGGLRRELLAGIRVAGKPMVAEAKAAARDRLPKKGGLNARVAGEPMSVRTRLTGNQVGIRIVTVTTDTRGPNRGVIRHPVFGHTDRWATQPNEASKGWFDDTLRKAAPAAQKEVLAAMETVAAKIEGA